MGHCSLRIGGTIPGVAFFIERWQQARIARNLATPAFWDDDGVLAPLMRIAEGKGKGGDLDEIASKLYENEKPVTKATRRILRARENLISTNLGMPVARRLSLAVNTKSGLSWAMAPCPIRVRIKDLVDAKKLDVQEATSIVGDITKFNRDLDSVHAKVRPEPKRARK